MTSRKKPGVAYWATVVVVVMLVAYPLSFGPTYWLCDHGILPITPVSFAYRPLVRIIVWKTPILSPALGWYGTAVPSPRRHSWLSISCMSVSLRDELIQRDFGDVPDGALQ